MANSDADNKENQMNRGHALVLGLLAVISLVWSQEMIENPEKPEHPDPGRVITLTEVLRIPSEGEGYYHNGANELDCDGQGNIYFHDFWSTNQRAHLLKFSPDGRFLGDFCRPGEGPGEVQSALDFVLGGERLFLYDYMRNKVIEMTLDGTFKREFKREGSGFSELIGKHGEWLVGMDRIYPAERRQSKMYDMRNIITLVDQDGNNEKELYTFTNRMFLIGLGQGGGGRSWDPFNSVIGEGRLFVCRTREYGIDVLDLDTGKITARFTRKYSRVKHESREWEREFTKKFDAPEIKFESDIGGLLYDGSRLWVRTSTTDPDKGLLFDAFDSAGRFLDSFFVPVTGRVVQLREGFLYVMELDEEELPSLVKYRITR